MERGTDKTRKPHHGRNVTRLREIRYMKQDILASLLGISTEAVSKLEQSETIEDEQLQEIAKALGFTPEMIKNPNDEFFINNIQNNYDGTTNSYYGPNSQITIHHPIDKIMELQEGNKKLYEALLKEKDEKIALQQKMIEMLEKK